MRPSDGAAGGGPQRQPGRLCHVGAGLLALALILGPSARAAEPVVPTFVDPHRQIDKPDLGQGRVIRFLTTDDHPPFNFTAPDGALAGFDIDLVRAICGTLEVVCSVQARSFESLIPALRSEAGDAVIASLAITAASRAEVAFTLPTMRVAARFAALANTGPATVLPETVGRMVIGVQAGTAHEAYLRAFFPRAVLKTYADPDSLRAALKTGAVDLLFADGVAIALWLNGTDSGGCCRFVGGPFTETRYFGEGTGIAVRSGDAALKQALDFALQRLSADGTTGDLYLKYFPLGLF